MDIYLDTTKGFGFGDQLCLLSLLSRIPTRVTLYSNDREQYYERLSQLVNSLRIPIAVRHTDLDGDFAGAYHLKTVCDYYYPNKLRRDLGTKNYIGLVLYNSTDGWVDSDYNFLRNDVQGKPVSEGNENRFNIPQRKYRSLEFYSKVFELCRRCGYDVITLDAHEKLDQKIDFLMKNCEAVIGYEGGVAHLCHMLKIPFLMFDHQYPNTNPYGQFQIEVMHQSRTMHLIRNDEKFLQMDSGDFALLIRDLKLGKTNNRIVNGEVKMSFINGVINSPIQFYNKDCSTLLFQSDYGPQVSDSAATLINQYFTIPKV